MAGLLAPLPAQIVSALNVITSTGLYLFNGFELVVMTGLVPIQILLLLKILFVRKASRETWGAIDYYAPLPAVVGLAVLVIYVGLILTGLLILLYPLH